MRQIHPSFASLKILHAQNELYGNHLVHPSLLDPNPASIYSLPTKTVSCLAQGMRETP